MRIRVSPGTRLQLDARRSVSTKGGNYDIGHLPQAEQKRILATKGVSEEKPIKKEESK